MTEKPLRRLKVILAGDRLQGTRDAEQIGVQPRLEGIPTGSSTPENKRIMLRPIPKETRINLKNSETTE